MGATRLKCVGLYDLQLWTLPTKPVTYCYMRNMYKSISYNKGMVEYRWNEEILQRSIDTYDIYYF